MVNLAETVKILKEAGARATFHENGQLKSIAFGPQVAPLMVGADGLPVVEPKLERTALDVVSEDAPKLDHDEEAAELYPLEAAEEGAPEPVEERAPEAVRLP